MSEQDEQRPLTRRERRMRDMAETGALDLSEVSTPQPDSVPRQTPVDDDVEISPFHEDGTPRSRREMRQLREEARAAQAGDRTESEVPAEPADTEIAAETTVPAAEDHEAAAAAPADADGEPAVEPAASTAAPEPEPETPSEAPTPAHDEVDFDTLISPPTEPLTVEELEEATQAAAGRDELAPAAEPEEDSPAEDAQAATPDSPEAAADEKPKRRFRWGRRDESTEDDRQAAPVDAAPNVAAQPEASAPEPATSPSDVDEAVAPEPVRAVPAAEVSADADAATGEEQPQKKAKKNKKKAKENGTAEAPAAPAATGDTPAPSVSAPADPAPADPAPAPVAAEPAAPAADAPEAPSSSEETPADDPAPVDAPVSVSGKTGYSFPDIAPPEEYRSVFDDPASRNVPDQSAGPNSDGDFDDLISRAVSQEGSTGTGSAALILPSMPEETGGLTGPLGATGEMYITGSLHLPKSMGETGGHSGMHDSIETDPITGEGVPEDPETTGQGPAPVSARHAVSARVSSDAPVVAKPAKERSKLPIVLAFTGGGLLVIVVGLGIWGATSGLFG